MNKHRLVIELDVDLIDETWTEQDLIDNAVIYFESALGRAEAESVAAGYDQAYTIDLTDVTVWTKAGYLADLADAE